MKMKSKNIFIIITIFVLLINCSEKEIDLHSIIGQQITSQPVQKYLNKINMKPEISRHDDCYFYIYESKGIDFRFNTSDSLTAIFLFSESSDNHRQFQSYIPYGINFNDTRKVIEEKLGKPNENGGSGVINFYSSWDMKGISITYKTTDEKDMNNRIKNITITNIK